MIFMSLTGKFIYEPFIKYVRKIFRKTNISNPLIRTRTWAYQGARNVSISENFVYVLHGWPLIREKWAIDVYGLMNPAPHI